MTALDPNPAAPPSRLQRAVPRARALPAVARGRARAYLALTKPRIIELLLITTVPTMILAAQGFPSPWLVLATVFGGALAAGSANTLNCYLDRDIDKVMHRTSRRPLVTGEISPRNALIFGFALGVASVAVLGYWVNPIAAWLALAANVFYVVGYTMLLKRRTPQNIVWGGAAGCMPVLIGWAAVTGRLSWQAWVLFGVVFLWTPAHYWPLSLRFRDDYAVAGVPMLPVVAAPIKVARQVVVYAWAMAAWSLLLVPATGLVYAAAAVLGGAAFVVEGHRLLGRVRRGEPAAPMRVFHFSISYLTVLFVAVAVDPFVPLSLFSR